MAEGYQIQKRHHPDPRRSVTQYRLKSPFSRFERKQAELIKEQERAANQAELFPDLKPQEPKEVFDE